MVKEPVKRKLTESGWAIRVGGVNTSKPYFVRNALIGDRLDPLIFRTYKAAHLYKRASTTPAYAKKLWAIVAVDVVER